MTILVKDLRPVGYPGEDVQIRSAEDVCWPGPFRQQGSGRDRRLAVQVVAM